MDIPQDDLENMMGLLGDFGRYQAWQFTLHILSAITAGVHMLSLVTVAAVPEHRCALPGVDNITSGEYAPWNSSEVMGRIPLTDSGSLDSCHVYDSNSNTTVACSQWVYDNTYYKSSRAIEWNFVCDQRWMGAISQAAFMLGVFFGAVILGGLADKFGRKKIFCISATMQLILGVLVAFVPEYYTFLVVRFFYGVFGSAGSYITGFVLTMELVGPSVRTVCGITFQIAFACGIMLDAVWGAVIKDRQLLQIVYGLHGFLLFFHWWLMDESPRWLWAQGKIRESVKIVQKALKMNKRGIALDTSYYIARGKTSSSKRNESEQKTAGALDLFKTPNLRYRTLNICLCWFANSLAYYGLSLNTGKMQGNPYLTMFLMGLVEMPSYIAIILLLDRLGRRCLISSMMLVGGICCISAAYMEPGESVTTGITMLGKLFISGSFAIVYNYSAELFPTVVRNTAMGIGSMCARLSGTLCPMLSLLDSFEPRLPSVVFAAIALLSGFLTLLLPETLGQPMPQSLEDGETFGVGDTCFSTAFRRRKRTGNKTYAVPDPKPEHMVPLEDITKKC